MKKLLLFLLVVAMVPVAQAQFSFGLRGGLNFSRLPEKTYTLNAPQNQISTLSESYTGFHVGVVSQISLLGIFIMPELLFVSSGHDLKLEKDGEEIFYQQKFSQIDIPVLVGTKIGPLRAGVGPVASIMLNSRSDLPEEAGFKERFNPATYGFQLGAGINLGNLAFDLKYQFGLSNLGDGIVIGGQTYDFDTRPRQIVFSIGLMLL